MSLNYLKSGLLIALIATSFSCSDDDDDSSGNQTTAITIQQVKENHANLVARTYNDAYTSAIEMQNKINTFVSTPTALAFTEAKQAWLDAREFYGLSEAFRETNSPVDVENSASAPWGLGTEGLMNAWPIDEGYIDYVQNGTEPYAGTYTSIISDSSIAINASTLESLNEEDTDKSISAGWHAIEFLLWGQDNTIPSDYLDGQRDFTDYTTAPDATRRGLYLTTATDLLVSNLQELNNTWANGGAYRTVFMALDNKTALAQLINGPFFMTGDELSSERMIAPVNSTDGISSSGQEDEHSCFSDNTNRDVYANAKGAYNVVFGSYDTINGASFYDLVNQVNPTQAASLRASADNAMSKVNIIGDNPLPFDYLITQELSTDASFGPVMTAVQALKAFADEISASANVIGINL